MKYIYSIADHSAAQLYFTASSHFPEFVNMDPKYSHALEFSFKAIFYFHTFYVTFCI